MRLQVRERLITGQEVLDDDLRALRVTSGPNGSFLYAATGRHGGISVHAIEPGSQAPRLSDTAFFADLAAGFRLTGLDLARLDGRDQVIYGTTPGGRLAGIGVDGAGQLDDRPQTPLGGDAAAALAMVSLEAGGLAAYSVAAQTGQLRAWRLSEDGSAPVGSVAQMAPGGALLAPVTVGDQQLLLAADSVSQGLTSYRIAGNGALTASDSVGAATGLGLASPSAIGTVQAFGTTWVILAAAGSGTLSVMRIDAQGGLIPTDHLLDSRDTRFGGVLALDVLEVGGRVFVVAGGADDGLSLFTLLPDGRLVHLQTLVHATGRGLDDIGAIEMLAEEDQLHVFVTGDTPGIAHLVLPLAELGVTRAQTGTQPVRSSGTDRGDLLAGRGADTLSGGAGDDILAAGAGGVLWGGAGADLFIPDAGATPLRIADFERGVDRIDLSALMLLRAPGQLSVTEEPDGVSIRYDLFTLRVTAADGQPLTAEDIWPNGFDLPDRLFNVRIEPGVALQGGAWRDTLPGGAGADTLWGGAGDDLAWGGAGADQLAGGDGRDTLSGGPGADTLWGGAGPDEIGGGPGDDWLWGGAGWDEVWGGEGNDRLDGGAGNDLVGGFRGDDTLIGGTGDDTIWAFYGDDTLSGGPGDDEMWGSFGADTLSAGDGNDTIGGYEGRDVLEAGAGDDEIWGGADNDALFGGPGNDTIWASTGNDRLEAGAGDDLISGGAGRDRLNGSDGDDTMSGGAREDVFLFGPGHGVDRITDFEPGFDRLQLNGLASGFDALGLSARGGNTQIETGGGTIWLEGISPAQLGAGDFDF